MLITLWVSYRIMIVWAAFNSSSSSRVASQPFLLLPLCVSLTPDTSFSSLFFSNECSLSGDLVFVQVVRMSGVDMECRENPSRYPFPSLLMFFFELIKFLCTSATRICVYSIYVGPFGINCLTAQRFSFSASLSLFPLVFSLSTHSRRFASGLSFSHWQPQQRLQPNFSCRSAVNQLTTYGNRPSLFRLGNVCQPFTTQFQHNILTLYDCFPWSYPTDSFVCEFPNDRLSQSERQENRVNPLWWRGKAWLRHTHTDPLFLSLFAPVNLHRCFFRCHSKLISCPAAQHSSCLSIHRRALRENEKKTDLGDRCHWNWEQQQQQEPGREKSNETHKCWLVANRRTQSAFFLFSLSILSSQSVLCWRDLNGEEVHTHMNSFLLNEKVPDKNKQRSRK